MSNSNGQKIYKSIMLVIVTAIITAILTTVVIHKTILKQEATTAPKEGTTKITNSTIAYTLSNFRKIIDKYYLGEVNDQALLEGAIKGYISGLGDEYSEYYTKEELEEYKQETLGNFVGIGIYMVKDEEKNVIRVLTPIKDTPAYNAGILPGDIIYKVDGITYTGDQMSEAAKKLKGDIGTKVKIELIRDTETVNVEIERATIKVNHVESEVLNNNIGYLKLSTFDEGCAAEFKQKYDELKAKNIKSLIIDLRNNGGGIVNEATDIADLFTKKDDILLITVDKDNNEEITKARKDKYIDVPVVILTNENTASASEILTAALKDNNIAKVVGTTTYGKGVIQNLLTLTDGTGIKITTNEYYTPNKSKINKVGITPDEQVELPEEYKNQLEIPVEKDTQIQKAIELLK